MAELPSIKIESNVIRLPQRPLPPHKMPADRLVTVELETESTRLDLQGYVIACQDYLQQLGGYGFALPHYHQTLAQLEIEIRAYNQTYPLPPKGRRVAYCRVPVEEEERIIDLRRRVCALALETEQAEERADKIDGDERKLAELEIMVSRLGQRRLYSTRGHVDDPHTKRIIQFAANPAPELNWMGKALATARAANGDGRYEDVDNIFYGFGYLDGFYEAARFEYADFFTMVEGNASPADQLSQAEPLEGAD
jgi:hypothetical protein